MPPEEADVLRRPLGRHDLDMIFLLAPTSTPERIQRVLHVSRGFVYFVSVAGVTGVKQADANDIRDIVGRIRRQTKLPVGIGFGITKPEQASAVAEIADAVVVGSEIARQIEEANDIEEKVARVGRLARALKAATRRAPENP
jgi:tryptophan synthase alpha chain